jgi:Uma2 family endonuclease
MYPDGDGKPMAETPFHVAAIMLLLEALQDLFAGRTDVFIAGNLFFYYEQGIPKRRVAPDGLVAKGVGGHIRRSYRLWEETAPPSVIFDVSSEDTWRKDLNSKRKLYARLGVAEYFLFDPEALYLHPPLQGFRLENGASKAIAPNPDGSLTSEELKVRLMAEGVMLRLIDARTGNPILTRQERIDLESRLRAEQQERADRLEAEVARLRALLPPETPKD